MSPEAALEGAMHVGAERMDDSQFHLLMEILRILERHHNDPEVQESVMEIIESYDTSMTQDQKALLLKKFLEFRHRDDERRRRFEEEARRQQIGEFMRVDYN